MVALCCRAPANDFHSAFARLLNPSATERAYELLLGLLRLVRLHVCEQHPLPLASKTWQSRHCALCWLFQNYVGGRLPKFGWFTNFYITDHFVARANIIGDAFFAYYRTNASLFLAANRLSVLAFPKYYGVVSRTCKSDRNLCGILPRYGLDAVWSL